MSKTNAPAFALPEPTTIRTAYTCPICGQAHRALFPVLLAGMDAPICGDCLAIMQGEFVLCQTGYNTYRLHPDMGYDRTEVFARVRALITAFQWCGLCGYRTHTFVQRISVGHGRTVQLVCMDCKSAHTYAHLRGDHKHYPERCWAHQ